MVNREWLIKRNCSLTPRQLGLAYSVLCLMSLLVAVFFTLRGAWYVFAFTLLELSAVGVAFLLYARHATDRERIALSGDSLVVEVVQVEQIRQFRLDARFTRVQAPAVRGALVRLEANGTQVEVGRFLNEWKRRELAGELRRALACG
ncbi:DUF2244 domain-containing protein [Oxalobacteraceae bacterium OM1]|nr:DUF2244 domain-containing protein [Oxalobacteraceae bacterium OM1]